MGMKKEDVKEGAFYVLMVIAVVTLLVALVFISFAAIIAVVAPIAAIMEHGDWSYLWYTPLSIVGGVAAFFVMKLICHITEWYL
jgi:hypothetical protein